MVLETIFCGNTKSITHFSLKLALLKEASPAVRPQRSPGRSAPSAASYQEGGETGSEAAAPAQAVSSGWPWPLAALPLQTFPARFTTHAHRHHSAGLRFLPGFTNDTNQTQNPAGLSN